MTAIQNLTRRAVCFAMAASIVAFGLIVASIVGDAAYKDAARAHVYVVQVA